MARRVTALFALLVIVALALTLLWRVYGHHVKNGAYGDEAGIVDVRLDLQAPEKFARYSA